MRATICLNNYLEVPDMPGSGKIIWICGLSGAGKSTLALATVNLMRKRGLAAVLFDGDELREVFGATESSRDNHGRDARLQLAMKYARLCRLVANQGMHVVIATISLFHEIHAWNRENLENYFEIYLKVPIEELRRRDSKRIYSRFESGEITNVAGLDMPIEEPVAPDLVIEFTSDQDIAKFAHFIFQKV
jgi:adenylylsulfate kinase-like enzyme